MKTPWASVALPGGKVGAERTARGVKFERGLEDGFPEPNEPRRSGRKACQGFALDGVRKGRVPSGSSSMTSDGPHDAADFLAALDAFETLQGLLDFRDGLANIK